MAPAGTSGIPESVINEYYEDAARLALRDIHDDEGLKDSLIIIPQESIDIYFQSLLQVFRRTELILPLEHAYPFKMLYRHKGSFFIRTTALFYNRFSR